MVKIVPIHSHLTIEEETALLKKAETLGIKSKKEAVRLAVQHYIECDVSEPDAKCI
jgi:hypothetical protein